MLTVEFMHIGMAIMSLSRGKRTERIPHIGLARLQLLFWFYQSACNFAVGLSSVVLNRAYLRKIACSKSRKCLIQRNPQLEINF